MSTLASLWPRCSLPLHAQIAAHSLHPPRCYELCSAHGSGRLRWVSAEVALARLLSSQPHAQSEGLLSFQLNATFATARAVA